MHGLDVEQGAGYVDAIEALELADQIATARHFNSSTPLISRTRQGVVLYVMTPAGKPRPVGTWNTVYGADATFGDEAFWSDGILWGDMALWSDGML